MEENASEQSLRELGRTLVSQKKWSEALLVYASIFQIPNVPSKQLAIAHSNRSFCYLQLKKLDEAHDEAVKSIDKAPEWFKGYLRLANVFLEKSEGQSACMAMENGIGKEEDNGTMEKMIKDVRMKFYPSLIKNVFEKEIQMELTILDTKKRKNEQIFHVELKEVAVIWMKEVFSRFHLRKEVMSIELLDRRRFSDLPKEMFDLKREQPEPTSEVWISKKIAVSLHPEAFSPNEDKETSFNLCWKYRTSNLCSYLNGGLLILVNNLISKKIYPYVVNLNEEKQYITSGFRLSCHFSKSYKKPWILCLSENHFRPLVVGSGMIDSKTCKMIGETRNFNHHLVAVFPIESKSEGEMTRKAQIIDLTSPQFDIFSYEQGFPYYSYRVDDLRNPDVEGLLLGTTFMGINEDSFIFDLKETGFNVFELWKEAQDASLKRILEIVKKQKK